MDSITLSLRDAERDAVASFNAGLQAHAAGDPQAALRLWNEAWDRSRALLPAAHNLLALHLDAGNYAAAAGLGQFNRRNADTASPAKDKDIVPSLHMSTIL